MEGGLAGFEEVNGLHLAAAGNALEVLAVLHGLNRQRYQFFMEFIEAFLNNTLGQRVLLDYSRKVTAVKTVLSDNERSNGREVVAVLPKELILAPFYPHQAAAVSDSEVIQVQAVKLRNELLAPFFYSLHVLSRDIDPDLDGGFLWPKEGRLIWLHFSALSHAF